MCTLKYRPPSLRKFCFHRIWDMHYACTLLEPMFTFEPTHAQLSRVSTEFSALHNNAKTTAQHSFLATILTTQVHVIFYSSLGPNPRFQIIQSNQVSSHSYIFFLAHVQFGCLKIKCVIIYYFVLTTTEDAASIITKPNLIILHVPLEYLILVLFDAIINFNILHGDRADVLFNSLLLFFCYSSVSYHPLPLVIQHDFDHSTLIRMNIFVLMPNNQDPQDISWHFLRSSWNPTATLLGPILPFPCSIFASLPPNKMAASKSAWDTDYLSSPSITSPRFNSANSPFSVVLSPNYCNYLSDLPLTSLTFSLSYVISCSVSTWLSVSGHLLSFFQSEMFFKPQWFLCALLVWNLSSLIHGDNMAYLHLKFQPWNSVQDVQPAMASPVKVKPDVALLNLKLSQNNIDLPVKDIIITSCFTHLTPLRNIHSANLSYDDSKPNQLSSQFI